VQAYQQDLQLSATVKDTVKWTIIILPMQDSCLAVITVDYSVFPSQ